MKKALSLILVLALFASLLCSAFAAGSKTEVIEPAKAVSEDGTEVKYEEKESEAEEVTPVEMAAAISNAIANAIAKGETLDIDVDPEKLVVVGQKDFDSDVFPVTLTLAGEGTEDVMIYVFALYEGEEEWELVYSGLGGEFEVVLEAKGTYAVVTEMAE